jgi:hypothetical protein
MVLVVKVEQIVVVVEEEGTRRRGEEWAHTLVKDRIGRDLRVGRVDLLMGVVVRKPIRVEGRKDRDLVFDLIK